MYKLNTILLKYDCDTTIKLIKKLKELKVTLPSYCYNIGSNIFKLELKEKEDKEVYRKNFDHLMMKRREGQDEEKTN